MASKLVRDYIPQLIFDSGKTPVTHDLASRKEHYVALLEKLKEETSEAYKANDSYELMQELSDVYEVISCLAKIVGCDIEDVKNMANVKRITRGSFTHGIMLDEVK